MCKFNHNQIREMESRITKKFLNDNKPAIIKIVGNFMESSKEFSDRGTFYLKGGNAFSLLKNANVEQCNGDYDFQFVPNKEQKVAEIDELIIGILSKVAATANNEYNLERINHSAFENPLEKKDGGLVPDFKYYDIVY